MLLLDINKMLPALSKVILCPHHLSCSFPLLPPVKQDGDRTGELKAGEFRSQLLRNFAEIANSENMIEDFPFITSLKVGKKESLLMAKKE